MTSDLCLDPDLDQHIFLSFAPQFPHLCRSFSSLKQVKSVTHSREMKSSPSFSLQQDLSVISGVCVEGGGLWWRMTVYWDDRIEKKQLNRTEGSDDTGDKCEEEKKKWRESGGCVFCS